MGKISVRLKRSLIGRTDRQKNTVYSLGLKKIGNVVEHEESPSVRGMIDKVRFLLDVTEI